LECSNLILPLKRVCDVCNVFFLPCLDIFDSEVVDALEDFCIISVSKSIPYYARLTWPPRFLRKCGVCTPGVMLIVTLAAATLA